MSSNIIPVSNNTWKKYSYIKRYLTAKTSKDDKKCTHNDVVDKLIENSPELLESSTKFCEKIDALTQEYIT